MSDIIQVENKFYIAVNSSYADDRVKVLNHIDTFGIFDRWGNIRQFGEGVQGIYHKGMRYISDLELRICDKRPLLLSSSIKEQNEILSVDLTNPTIVGDTIIPKDVLYIGRSKFLHEGACFEEIRLSNYGYEPYEFKISLEFDADFKDIFEVRGIERKRRGEVYEVKHVSENDVMICYLGLDDVRRFACIHFSEKPGYWEHLNKAIFTITLQPQEQRNIEYEMRFMEGDEKEGEKIGYARARKSLEEELEGASELIADITTSNELFTQWIGRSKHDILSLLSDTEYGKYPYAGVPWYNTAFGRDGIITALQTLSVAPDIARDVLLFLASTQATEENAFQDAEPGKVIHEVRGGEMAALKEIPFKRYYGSVDATPLFVVLAGAYYARTADADTINKIWDNIEAALNWIDNYADIDGDGFFDYHHKSENGLTNQGWKDSFDSISDEHGNLASPPIALCEVQGYIYQARKQASKLAEIAGKKDMAAKLDEQAEELKKRFNERYWDDGLQCYVLALDGEKKSCRVVASNTGHCLFSGIADEDKAKKIAKRLFKEDMFSGWGIRTLSSDEKRYNPMSYHNGSIWPHDVTMIARGFSRYGLMEETVKLTDALFNASLFIELQRLPELFCGFAKRRGEGPTNYPIACSPQAWAVASVFMLLEACLRMEILAEEKKVVFNNPVLPEDMTYIKISRLKLGKGHADVELYLNGDNITLKVHSKPEDWEIVLL